jgi:hypothetical protein
MLDRAARCRVSASQHRFDEADEPSRGLRVRRLRRSPDPWIGFYCLHSTQKETYRSTEPPGLSKMMPPVADYSTMQLSDTGYSDCARDCRGSSVETKESPRGRQTKVSDSLHVLMGIVQAVSLRACRRGWAMPKTVDNPLDVENSCGCNLAQVPQPFWHTGGGDVSRQAL